MSARPEPISVERLALLRALDLSTLLPHSTEWSLATQAEVGRCISHLAPVLTELLDEIDALDDALEASETELEQLAQSPLPARPRPAVPRTQVRSASLRRSRTGRWQVRWREGDGSQRSQSFDTREQAYGFRADLLSPRRLHVDRPLIEAPTTLDQAAAVHALLAAHPELETLPLKWSFSEKWGLRGDLSPAGVATPEAARILAAALGVEVCVESRFDSQGERLEPHRVSGVVKGVAMEFTAYVPVPPAPGAGEDEQQAGGVG